MLTRSQKRVRTQSSVRPKRRNKTQPASTPYLCPEIVEHILGFAVAVCDDMTALMAVCKQWKAMASAPHLLASWARHFLARTPWARYPLDPVNWSKPLSRRADIYNVDSPLCRMLQCMWLQTAVYAPQLWKLHDLSAHLMVQYVGTHVAAVDLYEVVLSDSFDVEAMGRVDPHYNNYLLFQKAMSSRLRNTLVETGADAICDFLSGGLPWRYSTGIWFTVHYIPQYVLRLYRNILMLILHLEAPQDRKRCMVAYANSCVMPRSSPLHSPMELFRLVNKRPSLAKEMTEGLIYHGMSVRLCLFCAACFEVNCKALSPLLSHVSANLLVLAFSSAAELDNTNACCAFLQNNSVCDTLLTQTNATCFVQLRDRQIWLRRLEQGAANKTVYECHYCNLFENNALFRGPGLFDKPYAVVKDPFK